MDEIEGIGGSDSLLSLIEFVRDEPRLWDRSSSEFITNFDAKLYHFSVIANRLNLNNVTGETVLNAWRELSEKYRRRLYDGKRRNGTTSWPYFSAMSFLRDQYEQTKWFRPTPSARYNPSPTPNVAQLVDTILTAHAVLDAEQTMSKQNDNNESQSSQADATGKDDFESKFDVIGLPNFHSYNENQSSDVDGSRHSLSPCTTATATVTPSVAEAKSPPYRLSRSRYEPFRSQQQNKTSRSFKGSSHKQQQQQHQQQQQQQQSDALSNTLSELTNNNNSVTEFLKTMRVNVSESANIESQSRALNSSTPTAGVTTPNNICCQQVDEFSKWENVGRVWVDMMRTIRSPQLALAAHKCIMNTLFAVLEADQHLAGTDPEKTRVRIRESAPQIEISMQ